MYLRGQPDEIVDRQLVAESHRVLLASVLGSNEAAKDNILYSYNGNINGFSATLDEEQAITLSNLPQVLFVFINHWISDLTERRCQWQKHAACFKFHDSAGVYPAIRCNQNNQLYQILFCYERGTLKSVPCLPQYSKCKKTLQRLQFNKLYKCKKLCSSQFKHTQPSKFVFDLES